MELTLDELVPYIRKNVPQSKAIKHMIADEKARIVRFDWQGRHFVVRTTLQTFELKQTRLFMTGASTLLQLLLLTKTSQQSIVSELVEKLDEATNLLKGGGVRPEDQQKGVALLQPIKSTLERMTGNRSKMKKAA